MENKWGSKGSAFLLHSSRLSPIHPCIHPLLFNRQNSAPSIQDSHKSQRERVCVCVYVCPALPKNHKPPEDRAKPRPRPWRKRPRIPFVSLREVWAMAKFTSEHQSTNSPVLLSVCLPLSVCVCVFPPDLATPNLDYINLEGRVCGSATHSLILFQKKILHQTLNQTEYESTLEPLLISEPVNKSWLKKFNSTISQLQEPGIIIH